jgi:hypothetical protein
MEDEVSVCKGGHHAIPYQMPGLCQEIQRNNIFCLLGIFLFHEQLYDIVGSLSVNGGSQIGVVGLHLGEDQFLEVSVFQGA